MNKNIYVLYGFPLKKSLSPLIHNATLKDSVYFTQPVHPNNLSFAIDVIRKFSWAGANITIPHKIEVMKFLDEINEQAKIIGAVNTIDNKNNKLIGYNTDVKGFQKSLPLLLKRDKAVILGAGGAARAIILGLIEEGFKEINIFNKTPLKADLIKNDYAKDFSNIRINAYELKDLPANIGGDILVNCTPLANPIPLSKESLLENFDCVYDLKYSKNIKLLQLATKANVPYVLNGLKMLILQAAYAQEIWTGCFPDIEEIEKELQ